MPLFVSGAKYAAMEDRAVRAEARVAELEKAAVAAAQQSKPATKKAVKKAAPKPTTVEEAPVATITEVDEQAVVETSVSAKDVVTPEQRAAAVKDLMNQEGATVKSVAAEMGVSETTVRRDLKK